MLSERPTGPIFVDMSDAILKLPIKDVVMLCNLAMNRMSLSDMAEVAHFAGLQVEFNLKEPSHE